MTPPFTVLTEDPYNRSHHHAIKKLENVPAGEGQYRLRTPDDE